jgi:acyl-CoA thioesterase FadM
MTARLVVHYRNPTPLHTELVFEGELTKTEGRKIHCTGRVRADGKLTAEAEGLFVSVDRGRFLTLLEERERRAQARKG